MTNHEFSSTEFNKEAYLALTHSNNHHFEDQIEDGQIRFDYKMRPGVVRKSNAIELMRSVGLEI